MIVGLALRMAHLELTTADAERVARPDLQIRPQHVVGQESRHIAKRHVLYPADTAELPHVDVGVVAVREFVATEPVDDTVMPDNPDRRMAAISCIGRHRPAAADMVDVAVRVDQGVDGIIGPASQRLHRAAGGDLAGGVETHQALIGAERDDVAERLDDRKIVVENAQGLCHAVDLLIVDTGVDHAARQLDGIFGDDGELLLELADHAATVAVVGRIENHRRTKSSRLRSPSARGSPDQTRSMPSSSTTASGPTQSNSSTRYSSST